MLAKQHVTLPTGRGSERLTRTIAEQDAPSGYQDVSHATCDAACQDMPWHVDRPQYTLLGSGDVQVLLMGAGMLGTNIGMNHDASLMLLEDEGMVHLPVVGRVKRHFYGKIKVVGNA